MEERFYVVFGSTPAKFAFTGLFNLIQTMVGNVCWFVPFFFGFLPPRNFKFEVGRCKTEKMVVYNFRKMLINALRILVNSPFK